MPISENFELLEAVDTVVEGLLAEHQERRKHWYYHEYIPWERGRNFKDVPWDVSQVTISEAARTSLVLNLLTEDNLPYYHSAIESHVPKDSALARWNHLWTAEEGQHAIALRSYLMTSRNCDPVELEDERLAVMTTGYQPDWTDPSELFAYTAAQELATRVSHRNAGKITDDPAAFEIMKLIAADENHHFIFYKGVMAEMLRQNPSSALKGIYRAFSNFEMPGAVIPNFMRRSFEIAKAGVYNLRVHCDRVIQPLIQQWGIADLTDLSSEGSQMQEKILALPVQLTLRAEKFEARYAPVVV